MAAPLPMSPTVALGRTGLAVSRLSFGTAYFGRYGDCLAPEAGAALLLAALERGVTTWDTSDDYGSHPHVAHALRRLPREQVVVISKITTKRNTLDNLLGELGTEYLDVLLAHCVTLRQVKAWRKTIRSWLPWKTAGRVRALGLSTHSAQVAALAANWPEIEVLLLPINPAGVTTPGCRFEDGGVDDMLRAAEAACSEGKGILAMKVMGGGALANDPASAIHFAAGLPYIHSLCIGMRSMGHIDKNLYMVDKAGLQATDYQTKDYARTKFGTTT
jgi:aryl-alcohol dehydrogenase-like predicted oxidoreductase